jgi:hypothetical protein
VGLAAADVNGDGNRPVCSFPSSSREETKSRRAEFRGTSTPLTGMLVFCGITSLPGGHRVRDLRPSYFAAKNSLPLAWQIVSIGNNPPILLLSPDVRCLQGSKPNHDELRPVSARDRAALIPRINPLSRRTSCPALRVSFTSHAALMSEAEGGDSRCPDHVLTCAIRRAVVVSFWRWRAREWVAILGCNPFPLAVPGVAHE